MRNMFCIRIFHRAIEGAIASRRTKNSEATVERCEPRRLFSGLDGSEINGLPTDERVSLYSFIGDWSQSNSEKWDMDVGGHHWTAPQYGVVERFKADYKVGSTYPVSITHTGTNRQLGPDYDYRAWIDKDADPAWTSGATTVTGTNYFAVDTNSPALLQKRASQNGTNAAQGKSAQLVIPGVDLDIDSDNNNGFTDPDQSDAEDTAENQTSGGKWVPVTNGDADLDNVPDILDSDGINHDFVPMKLYMSSNLSLDTGATGKVTLTFDSSKIRIWTENGTSNRNGTVTSGQQISSLTMQPGDLKTFYVEGIAAGTAAGLEVKASIDVTGGQYWSGTLTDKVRVIPYTLTMEKTYSDQFVDGKQNSAPGNTGGVTDYIMMGTRSDNYAYARADIKLSPDIAALKSRLMFGFGQEGFAPDTSSSFSLTNNLVRTWSDGSGAVPLYYWRIEAGLDMTEMDI